MFAWSTENFASPISESERAGEEEKLQLRKHAYLLISIFLLVFVNTFCFHLEFSGNSR